MTIQDARTEPFSLEEIREQYHKTGRIQGVVAVPLNLILYGHHCRQSPVERFNDFVSKCLIGSDLLIDISYNLIGCDASMDLLYFEIDGDPSQHLESEDT